MTAGKLAAAFGQVAFSYLATPSLLLAHWYTQHGGYLYLLTVLTVVSFVAYVTTAWYSLNTASHEIDLHDRLWGIIGDKITPLNMIISHCFWIGTIIYTMWVSYYFLTFMTVIIAICGHFTFVTAYSAHRRIDRGRRLMKAIDWPDRQ